jgi:hypothetical protein
LPLHKNQKINCKSLILLKWNSQKTSLVSNSGAPVMALGDFLGTLIVLYILKLTLFLAELILNKSNQVSN